MADVKSYLDRNLKKVLKAFYKSLGKLAGLDKVTEDYLSDELKAKINSVVSGGADFVKKDTADDIDLTASDAGGHIYLVPDGKKSGNLYIEYIVVDGALEEIGSTAIDLSGYVKLTDLATETTGDGNVVTNVAYDTSTGKTTATKGITALTGDDLEDFTDDEVAEIISEAKKDDTSSTTA